MDLASMLSWYFFLIYSSALNSSSPKTCKNIMLVGFLNTSRHLYGQHLTKAVYMTLKAYIKHFCTQVVIKDVFVCANFSLRYIKTSK